MKIKLHSPSDITVDGKVKTLKAGEHDLSDSVARKLVVNGVATYVVAEAAATPAKSAKAVGGEA